MPARKPLSIQYLGVPGATHECVQAMVTILTSPYPCQEITVVVRRNEPGERHNRICFVVWEWLGRDVTIVPDGFGTHGGTGGWGLAIVLELIQRYRVPMKEKWATVEQFERIADGRPTGRDIALVREADSGAPSWPLWQGTYGSKVWRALITLMPQQFPYWLLEPELLTDVGDVESEPETAVFRTVKRLEIIIRQIGGFDPRMLGQQLIEAVFGQRGTMPLHGAVASEAQSWTNLFRGAIGAFKNPQSHRDAKLELQDAAGEILAVNRLLRKLKGDFPDRFARRVRGGKGTRDLQQNDDDLEQE